MANAGKAKMIRKNRHGGLLLQFAKRRMHCVFVVTNMPTGQGPMTWEECITSLEQKDVRPPQ